MINNELSARSQTPCPNSYETANRNRRRWTDAPLETHHSHFLTLCFLRCRGSHTRPAHSTRHSRHDDMSPGYVGHTNLSYIICTSCALLRVRKALACGCHHGGCHVLKELLSASHRCDPGLLGLALRPRCRFGLGCLPRWLERDAPLLGDHLLDLIVIAVCTLGPLAASTPASFRSLRDLLLLRAQ